MILRANPFRLLVPAVMLALASCGGGGPSNQSPDAAAGGSALSPKEAAERVWCPEVERSIPRANCDDLTRTADLAQQGVAAFNVPPLKRGETTTIQLAMGYQPAPVPATAPAAEESAATDNAVAENASAGATPQPEPTPTTRPATPAEVVEDQPGPTRTYNPIVGRYMRAELTGTGFEIVPKSPLSQQLYPDSQTTWEWEVTPLKADNYMLSIKTAVEGVTDNERYVLRSTVRNQTVSVETPWTYWLWDSLTGAPAWIKAITAVLTALAALAAAWWGLRRAFAGTPPAPPPPPPAA